MFEKRGDQEGMIDHRLHGYDDAGSAYLVCFYQLLVI